MNYNEFKAEFMKRLAEKAVQSDLIGTYQMFEDGMVSENPRYAKSLSFREIGDVIDQYEMVKDRLILRPLNYTDNKYVLKKIAYRQVGDMALVLYLVVADTEEFGLNTTKVPREVMELWGKTEEEVFENALINTNIRSVPRMYNSPAVSGCEEQACDWHEQQCVYDISESQRSNQLLVSGGKRKAGGTCWRGFLRCVYGNP